MKNFAVAALCLAVGAAFAGPASNNIAYKCTINGKTSYSDAPCESATVVNTTPTEGLESMTGKAPPSPSRAMKQAMKDLDAALAPITGMNQEQMAVYRRRFKHEPGARKRCYQLDDEIPAMEKANDSEQLFRARTEYYRLKC